jgi:hypothetical protein
MRRDGHRRALIPRSSPTDKRANALRQLYRCGPLGAPGTARYYPGAACKRNRRPRTPFPCEKKIRSLLQVNEVTFCQPNQCNSTDSQNIAFKMSRRRVLSIQVFCLSLRGRTKGYGCCNAINSALQYRARSHTRLVRLSGNRHGRHLLRVFPRQNQKCFALPLADIRQRIERPAIFARRDACFFASRNPSQLCRAAKQGRDLSR